MSWRICQLEVPYSEVAGKLSVASREEHPTLVVPQDLRAETPFASARADYLPEA
jgi:hypothetical protein